MLPIVQTVLACLLWGTIFALPLVLKDFSYLDIVLGRFFIYGLLSLAILGYFRAHHLLRYWKEAALAALIMNFIHFGALTLGCRYTCASLITLVMGISPITIILADSWITRDKKLISIFIIPSLAIFAGLALMNVEALKNEIASVSCWGYVQGIFWGVVALATWTWYVVYNSRFVARHPEVSASQWTALIGLMTLIFAAIGIGARYLTVGSDYFMQFHWELESGRLFLATCLFLGIFCSWIAFVLWNAASASISAALAGQLSILETIFGLLFVYSIQTTLPSLMELLGISCIVAGISLALHRHLATQVHL